VQSDVAAVLAAPGPAARAASRAALARALRRLDAQRSAADQPIRAALAALAVRAALPRLPGGAVTGRDA
jgi:hypothetical protein